MKIEIRIGNVESGKRIKFLPNKLDCVKSEISRMYDFLNDNRDCIIEDVDNFLLYTLNNGLMASIVKDNSYGECDSIPKYNPEEYKAFEISDDGSEVCLNKFGTIRKNYLNDLMRTILDDYYLTLNFYDVNN